MNREHQVHPNSAGVTSSQKLDSLKVEEPGETKCPQVAGGFAMKKSKFTEEQIAFALKQADAGTKVP
jgi:putative transposase